MFCHTGRALLPELAAYIEFASLHNIECDVIIYDELEKISFAEYDVLWNFMGRDISFKVYLKLKRNNCLYLKEFASCSVKPFPKIKNVIKSLSLKKADIEVYLNPLVEKQFTRIFSKTPRFYRDMGISDSFFSVNNEYHENEKKYDFVYVGAMDDKRRISLEIAKLLDKVDGNVLLIGEPSPLENSRLRDLPGVTITGRVPYKEVPRLLSSAHIGLNIMPDEYPYNIQTSTKLIEYLALGIPVITSSYTWVNEFVVQEQCRERLVLVDSFSDVTANMITTLKGLNRSETTLHNKNWNTVINNSGIFQHLKSNITEN